MTKHTGSKPVVLLLLCAAGAFASPRQATAGADPFSYHTVTPCRVFDSRDGAPLQHGTPVEIQISAEAPCNLSSLAAAVALNVTVVSPTQPGELVVFSADQAPPAVNHVSFSAGQVRASIVLAVLSSDGRVVARAVGPPGGTYHLVLDVAGYFALPGVVFATSFGLDGDFAAVGGLGAADDLCTNAANIAGLPGTFVAFVSDSNTDARDRLTGDGPWILPGTQATVADNKADLLDGSIDNPIDRTEHGVLLGPDDRAWTGSEFDGTATSDDCGDWTSNLVGVYGTAGRPTSTNDDWTDFSMATCNNDGDFRLYCFQNAP